MRKEVPVPTAASQPLQRSWGVLFNSLIVMVGFVLSRILGLVRDSVFNAYFGTSAAADVYRAAFNLPDLLYLVVIGGALGSAFIPVFAELSERDGAERAWQLTNAVMTAALAVLAILSLLIGLAARPLLAWNYPAFTPEQLDLATYLSRIFLLSPLLLGLGGLAMAVLNATDRFTLPALAPTFYNLAIIIGIVVFAPLWAEYGWQRYPDSLIQGPDQVAYSIEGVAWGVVLGAGCYLLLQLPGLARAGFRPRLRFQWRDRAVQRVGMLMGPRVFGQAAMQINLIIMSGFASILGTGRVAALNQAYQLMLLPHGIFALSLATVMFPHLARSFNNQDMHGFGTTVETTLRNVLWMVIPAAVGLAVLCVPLVRVLFQRGEFDNQSTQLVAYALLFYAAALPAFAASEILIRAFYATQDTWTPVLAGLITVGFNLALCAWFVFGLNWSHTALAGAFALSNNLEVLLLGWWLRRRIPQHYWNGTLARSLVKACSGALVMGAVLGLLAWFGNRHYPGLYGTTPVYTGTASDVLVPGAWLAGSMLLGGCVYIAMAAVLGADEWHTWRERLLKRWRKARSD